MNDILLNVSDIIHWHKLSTIYRINYFTHCFKEKENTDKVTHKIREPSALLQQNEFLMMMSFLCLCGLSHLA